MDLVNEFKKWCTENEINLEDILFEDDEENNMHLISFSESNMSNKDLLNIVFVIYDDGNVEIHVLKHLINLNMSAILTKLNDLNNEYRGLTFCYLDESACIKTNLYKPANIEEILTTMSTILETAKSELAELR